MARDHFDFWDIDDEVYNAIRAAELAAEGAALRASARAALMHRVAWALLGISLLLGICMLVLPPLRPWSGEALWVFLLGLVSYLLIVAIAYWSRPTPSAPELRTLQTIRHDIAALLLERRRARGAYRDLLIRTLSDAIRELDDHIIPTLHQLIERRANLERELRRYDRGVLYAPKPELLGLLRRLHTRLQTAIDECVQQAANAYAMLVALLGEGDDENVARRAEVWAASLTTLYEALNEVLRGAEDPGTAVDAEPRAHDEDVPTPADGADDQPDETQDHSGRSEVPPDPPDVEPPVEVVPGTPSAAAAPSAEHDVTIDGLHQDVEDALRRVRDRGDLVNCALIASLPWTIGATLRQRGVRSSDATPLEQAAALQHILTIAVDRLRPDAATAGHNANAMLYFQVLRGQYFEARPILQMRTRHSIAETTYHRYRRRAIRILAGELIEQEALARRNGLNGQESA